MTFGIKQMTRALSFAHLTGGTRSATRAQEDDDDDDKAARAQEDDDKPKDDDKDSRKGKRAQDDDDKRDDASAEDEDDKPDDEDKGRRSKRARSRAGDGEDEDAEDDDDDEEMRGKSAIARARLREQARCASIFACETAGRNPTLAANLAFRTRLPRQEAIAVLQGTPAPASAASAASAERAARNPRVGPGGSPYLDTQQAIAASWDRAFARVNNPHNRRMHDGHQS